MVNRGIIPDPMVALIKYLLSIPPVWAHTNGNVYGVELLAASAEFPCVVITSTGGRVPSDYVPRSFPRFDIKSYGNTVMESRALDLVVYKAMRGMDRAVQDGVLLYSAQPDGGPIDLRDSDARWPSVWRSYSVMVAEQYVS